MSSRELRSVWIARVGAAALVVGSFSCAALTGTSEPVAGDNAGVNEITSARMKDLPYCPGGNRGKSCVFGQNCRVTEQGCQVCQCQTLE